MILVTPQSERGDSAPSPASCSFDATLQGVVFPVAREGIERDASPHLHLIPYPVTVPAALPDFYDADKRVGGIDQI